MADRVDIRAELEAQVARLKHTLAHERDDMEPDEALQFERVYGQCLASLAKLDGTQISEPVIVRHPAHQRVMAVVFAALEAYPEAARAVADALKAAAG